MELIKQHILPCLHSFLNEKSSTFDSNFNETQSDLRDSFDGLIRYLDKLFNKALAPFNETLGAIHIHLEDEFTDLQKLIIAEYLLIKTFKLYNLMEDSSSQINIELNELIAKLASRQKSLEMRCPDEASGKNGGNRIWKKWIKDKKDNRSLLEFYRNLKKNTIIKPKLIFNTQVSFCRSISQIFEIKPYCVLLKSKYMSYNLLNATHTLNEIDAINNEIIDGLDSIVLFNCERKSLMSNFSFEEINKWNSDYDTNFKKYLIITFGKEVQSINSIRTKLDTIRQRFKIPIDSSYTILRSEIDFLLKRKEKTSASIEFVGLENSSFWDTFILESSIRDLYELRSIKLMNIYSICFSSEIKNYILDDIFLDNEPSELITSSTKSAILEFSDDSIKELKESLSLTLDLIINSEMKEIIAESLNDTTSIFLDERIIRNAKLKSYLEKSIGVSRSIKLKGWSDFSTDDSTKRLFLSYRDQGKHPNYFYPNLLELQFQGNINAIAILPKLFFFSHYKWAKFSLNKSYYKHLSHPIREYYFDWAGLKKIIQAEKPENELLNFDSYLENEYLSSESRETYKIKLRDQRNKSYYSSDLIIYSENNLERLRIERVKWFYENIDFDETKYKIQKLDELLDEFNPAEKLIDTTQQEIELEAIRKKLGLENESAGRIWKVLLKKKSTIVGIGILYDELKQIFFNNNIPLVKKSYFINSWLNIESDTLMPRGNKVVKVLFDYLNLSNNYRLILYRLKNASISGKIEATRKYSNLLKDLFEDGCFDSGVSLETLLQTKIVYYQRNHSFEELGIDNENPLIGLSTLIELIQPEIKLLELESIEKTDP